jgi:hypothetical protein
MKKVLMVAALTVASFVMMSCVSVNSPYAVTTNPIGTKVGQASGTVFFGIFGTVDAGVQKAAQNGGITKIATVDTETKMFLGAMMLTYTTTVTGE